MVELDAWRIFISTGGTPQTILEHTQEQETFVDISPTAVTSTFNFKHRWICAQCYKNGQIVERKGKTLYCSSRGSHSWRDPMLYCNIGKSIGNISILFWVMILSFLLAIFFRNLKNWELSVKNDRQTVFSIFELGIFGIFKQASKWDSFYPFHSKR